MLEKNRIHSLLPARKSPFSLFRDSGRSKPQRQQGGDGSQAGTAGVWPLRVTATERPRLPRHQAGTGAPSRRLRHGSHVPSDRERELPIPFCGQGSRAQRPADQSCARAVGAGAMPWSRLPRSTPGVPSTTDPSSRCQPLPQPLSFLSIGLLSSPTITQGRVQPDHPCATKGCGGGCGLCFKELKPDSASSKVKEEEVPRLGGMLPPRSPPRSGRRSPTALRSSTPSGQRSAGAAQDRLTGGRHASARPP